MTPLEEFLEEIEAAIEVLEMSASTYGRLVAGDPGFVFGLRKGREPRLSTMERVRRRTEVLQEEKAADPAGRQEPGSASAATGIRVEEPGSASGTPGDSSHTILDRRVAQGEAQRQPPETGRSRVA